MNISIDTMSLKQNCEQQQQQHNSPAHYLITFMYSTSQFETTAPLSYLISVLDTKHASFKYIAKHSDIGIFSFPSEGDVWFSLRNTTYQNNSVVTLEDIGEGDNALFCMTNLTACCHGDNNALGNRKSVRFLQNQRSDGAWYICTAEEVERMESTTLRYLMQCMLVTQTIFIGVYLALQWLGCRR